jgi:hypothetical protein
MPRRFLLASRYQRQSTAAGVQYLKERRPIRYLRSSNAASASSGRRRVAAVRFSRRCTTDDVPAIRRMFAAQRSNQAMAIWDQSLTLEVRERGETCFDRVCGSSVDAEHVAKVDDVENIDPQVAQVVMHRAD